MANNFLQTFFKKQQASVAKKGRPMPKSSLKVAASNNKASQGNRFNPGKTLLQGSRGRGTSPQASYSSPQMQGRGNTTNLQGSQSATPDLQGGNLAGR